MANNYIATAYSSNLVKFSAVGNFLSDKEQHLLTLKSRFLEVHTIHPDEVLEYKQVRVPSSIAGLWAFRPKDFPRDLVVLLTRQYEFFVLELMLNLKQQVQICTRCTGKYPSSDDLIKLDAGPLAMFHAENRFMCLALYSQRLEIVEFLPDFKSFKAYPIRIPGPDGVKLIAMDFLNHSDTTDCTMALLQGTNRGPVLSFSHLNIRTREKEKAFAIIHKLNPETDCLLVVPGNKVVPAGALVVGNGSVEYYNTTKVEPSQRQPVTALSPFLTKINVISYCVLYKDPAGNVITYLLGGADGRLVLLVVRLSTVEVFDDAGKAKKPPCRINVEFIGVASAAQTLTVVGHGLVYLGTAAGPGSLLIKLRDASRNPETKFYYDILQTFPALGSILELHVVKNMEKQGLDQSYLLACTADTFGSSLTIIRSGINLQEPIEVPVAGIQKAWYVPPVSAGEKGKTFVLTDFATTRYCMLEEEDLREIEEVGDLEVAVRTILFHQMSETVCLQVTPTGVNLLRRSDLLLLDDWRPQIGNITAAYLIKNTVAVVNGNLIHLLNVNEEKLLSSQKKSFENEVCSVGMFVDQSGSLFLAAGEWITSNISIVECGTEMAVVQPALSASMSKDCPSDVQPRSLLFCQFSQDVAYFFCGRGDGNVDYFHFNEQTKSMGEHKRIPLGTRLVTFTQFRAQGQVNVFACSDRPCVISCRNGKLIFSNVNIPDAVDVCPFQPQDGGAYLTDDLMVITASSLLMGHLEDIQKIHFIPLRLGFQVFRLALQPGSATLAVIGDKKDSRINKFAIHKSPACTDDRLLYILDRHSFEVVTTFQCEGQDEALVCVCHWSPGGKTFLVLGTERRGDGCLIILELINDRLQVIHTYTCEKEAIRNVAAFGEFLLATTDDALLLFQWLEHQLDVPKKIETCGSLSCHLDYYQNTILIGDFQKSLVLAEFNPSSLEFDITAKDLASYGFVSLMLRDRKTVMGGDDRGNLLILTRKEEGEGDAPSQILQPLSWISVGDPVTTIKRGSLVSRESIGETSVEILDSFVFGTCKGQLGVIFELEEQVFKLLKYIESRLLSSTTVMGTSALSSSLQFCNRLMEGPHTGFIDGDLVETALQLRRSQLEEFLDDFRTSNDQKEDVKDGFPDSDMVMKILDDLVRLH